MAYAGGAGDIPGGEIGPNVNDGEWHHLVAVSEHGVKTEIWVDGGLVATGGAANIIYESGAALLIGANPGDNGGNREWFGQIDDVAQWGRALSADDIAVIYQAGQAGQSLGETIIPEPTSLVLAMLGLLPAALCRSRRRRVS